MTPQTANATEALTLPDHTQLPDKDGAIVVNDQEHPQSALLSGCLWPRLEQLYGERFTIGRDHGIYWSITDPPLNGCKAPDWYLVPGVPRMLDGTYRRSYVLWREFEEPLVVIEYVSGDGSEERDRTANTGKFWVYEHGIKACYYIIFDATRNDFEAHHRVDERFQAMPKNEAGRVAIAPLGIELGIWHGRFENMELPWLRAWDIVTGAMLPSTEERAEIERLAKEAERARADVAEALVDDANRMREEETERAETERKRADKEAEEKQEQLERADKEAEEKQEQLERADKATELAEAERQRAEKSDERAQKAAEEAEKARLKAENERKRAGQAEARADKFAEEAEKERKNTEEARKRAEKLAELLRQAGIDPEAA